METLKIIVFYLLLIDSLAVNFMAWFCQKWYEKKFPSFSRYLPLNRLWTGIYLGLVLWIGFITFC